MRTFARCTLKVLLEPKLRHCLVVTDVGLGQDPARSNPLDGHSVAISPESGSEIRFVWIIDFYPNRLAKP